MKNILLISIVAAGFACAQQNFVNGKGGGITDAPAFRNNLGIPNVENIAISTWAGSSNIVNLGTITTGTWNGTAIGDSYISSAATWNAKQSAITFGTGVQTALGVNIGSAGAPVLFNGALGTPSSGSGANLTSLNGSNISSGTVAADRLGSGGGAGKFLRYDNTWQTIGGGGDLLSTNNLSDLANFATARDNLGVEIGVDVQAYSAILAGTTASFLTADETKIDWLTVTQAVNLDTLESDTATNNAKVTNATHTGDATGSGALTVVAINGTNLAGLSTGLLKNTTGTGVPSIAVAGTDYLTPTGSAAGLTSFPTLNQNTTGSAATLTTGRTFQTDLASTSAASFNGSANVTPGVTGTLAVTNGGTGRATSTTAYGLIAAGTTATGAHQTVSPGTSGYILQSAGTAALPVWAAPTGTGSPVLDDGANMIDTTITNGTFLSPQMTTPSLGVPTSGTLTNCTGYLVAGLSGLGTGNATALAINVGTSGSFITNGGAAGTPSSITLTNATGLPTAGLLNDSVTLGKVAHGTAGNLITFDATGAPTTVATGTAGHVLTSNGAGAAPTFQAASGITRGTSVASTSGTSHDFTGIPSGVKRITVMFDGVSTNGTSPIIIQLGDSGGLETGNTYDGSAAEIRSTPTVTNSTTGIQVCPQPANTDVFHGVVTIVNITGNRWVASVAGGDAVSLNAYAGGTSKSLSDVLTQLRVTTTGGTATFDLGNLNIMYE